MRRFFVTLFGSFFYCGYFPIAPATFASFIWALVWLFVPGGRHLTHPVAIVAVFPIAIYCASQMEKVHGHDASKIVIDEFMGMQVSLFMMEPSISLAAAGFFLFRFFDILKPFPVGRSQKLRGGLGVVADDLLAGVYSYIALYIITRFIEIV